MDPEADDFSSREPPAGAHHLAHDLSSALQLVETELAEQADQVWVIGGSSLYQVQQQGSRPQLSVELTTSHTLPEHPMSSVTQEVMERPGTRRLFVTRILKQFDCDTFLPEIRPDQYRQLPQ